MQGINLQGCQWLTYHNIENSEEYNDKIKKLTYLQNWFKKLILSKRLIKIIPGIMPIYYHPDSKGGYLHKRDMLNFYTNLTNNSGS